MSPVPKPTTRKPTDRQLAIHAFMVAYQKEHGMPPTLREIANRFELSSTNGVSDHLDAMLRKGLVKHVIGIARGWVPT